MADRNNADSLRGLAVDPPPRQIPKDMQESDNNPIPLSPQWLLPKAGDNKEFNLQHGNRSDPLKLPVDNEDFYNSGKKSEAFRPSHEVESGRWDRWREEERETNSIRRERRWEGDKDSNDTNRRMDRWSEFSTKHSGEARRTPAEKWNDSNNREGDQRRESKWNTRWGPDDKESENWRNKRLESRRDGDGAHERAIPYQAGLGKDINTQGKEIESDDHHSRSWKSNYFVGRGRGDSFHNQSMMPGKQASPFYHGRGRTENGISASYAGRGRFNSSASTISNSINRTHHLTSFSDKFDGASGDPPSFRYTRMKLLDIYRSTDLRNSNQLACFHEIPSLIQAETLEPLALSAPTPDESVILKGIDKGDIINSGATQVSKDGSVGKTMTDVGSSRPKLDSDLTSLDEPTSREVNKLESSPYGVPQRTQMTGSHIQRSSVDLKDSTPDFGSRESYLSMFHFQKDIGVDHKHTDFNSSIFEDESKWQNFKGIGRNLDTKGDPMSKQQPPEVMEENKVMLSHEELNSRDVLASRKLQFPPSPEDLSLYYKDPQGQIQGPFSGSDLIGWFEAGYFGIDLPVRLVGSPPDFPFSPLGDVMPHLRLKARPPPGFPMAKQIDTLEESYRLKFGGPSNVQTGPGEFVTLKNERRGMHDIAAEAQSRFLESMMSGNVGASSKEDFTFNRGIQEFGANLTSGITPSMGGESGSDMSYLSAQTRLLERQKSLSNPLSYWPMRDASPQTSKLEMISDPLTPHSKVLEPEASQHPQPPQHVNLLSLLHAASDKSSHPNTNTGASSWSNFNESRNQNNHIHGIGVPHDKLGLQHNQLMSSGTSQIGFNIQQARSLVSNQPTLPHLIAQPGDISSFLPPENLFSSDISQDPRLLSLLQQQYLLSQLQLQSQVPVSPQLSLLDKIMLLQQQQKQEQQHQLLMQHQQHLLNQVLTGQQAHQQFGDPAYGQADAAIPTGNNSKEHLGLQRLHEPFKLNQQMSSVNLQSEQQSYLHNVALQSSLDVNSLASQHMALHSPHEIFEQSAQSTEPNTSIPRGNDDNSKDSVISQTPVITEILPLSEALNKHENVSITQLSGQDLGNAKREPEVVLQSQSGELNSPICSEDLINLQSVNQISSDFGSSISDQVHGLKISPVELSDQRPVESPLQKEANNTESRDSKKASEKKSKKQKNSKAHVAADNGKVFSKAVSEQKTKAQLKSCSPIDANEVKSNLQKDAEDLIVGVEDFKSFAEPEDPERSKEIPNIISNESKVVEAEAKSALGCKTMETQPTHRAWKPASGLKPKSLLEIQQEEQLRAQKQGSPSEIASVVTSPSSSSAPWSGVVMNSENKPNKDAVQMFTSISGMSTSEKKLNANSSRSHLHDLLAEEVLANTNETNTEQFALTDKVSTLPLHVPVVAQAEISVADGDDFVEAKDTRKNRRKASKSKGSAVKTPSPIGSADTSAVPSPIDKGKSFCQVQLEKESLPALPSGPSLGDFVPWKGDQANSSSTPAWSMDSGKNIKPTSLRDILREQEKVISAPQQVPVPAMVQPNRSSQGSGASWQVSGSSPSHLASPRQSSQGASILRSKVEDDLFWGPLEQVKPDPKRSDFPSLSNAGSLGAKGGSAKGAPGAAPSRAKPSGELSADRSTAASIAVPKGGRVDAVTNSSEALDFRNWFQHEWIKLTGTNDTSFLAFCVKQSTSEAEMLLRENLGSLDRNHEFIDKFLNYKEFLSADVIEIAFQAQKSNISSSDSKRHGNSNIAVSRDTDGGPDNRIDEVNRGGGGKKKSKKGQKVSPSVLGFNVVSNRIMMGEIQSIE